MWWWWLAACENDEVGHKVQSAEASACLDAPGELPTLPVTFTGVALADGAPEGDETWDVGARCETVTRRLEVVDAQRRSWKVGYGWTEAGVEATTALEIEPQASLEVTFEAADDHAGFVITEADLLIAAVAVGIGDPGLSGDAVRGLSVSDGRTTGREETDCGTEVSRAISFDGDDDPVEIEPVDADWMRVDSLQVRTWAFAAWGMRDATCPQDGELSWAVWRDSTGL